MKKNESGAVRRVKKTISQRILESAELPLSAAPFMPQTLIEVNENMALRISSCKRIIEYSEERISLSLGRYLLVIEGYELRLQSCRDFSLELTGVIDSIQFIKRTAGK